MQILQGGVRAQPCSQAHRVLWPAVHSGLEAVAQIRVSSSQTRNLSLSFLELLVTTHGVQTLERLGRPNSS